jgi:hypothetical protein
MFWVLAALPLISAVAVDDFLIKRAQVCGSKGYDTGKEAYFDKSGKGLGSLSACSAHCLADSKCQSFAFSSNECLHYSVAV